MNQHPDTESPLVFPCRIDVKAMGRHEEGFTELVVEIVQRHVQDIVPDAVRTNTSRAGNYVSVTVAVHAESRAQMDALYHELTAHEKISVAL